MGRWSDGKGHCPKCFAPVEGTKADCLCPRHHAEAVARLRQKEAATPGCRYQPPLTADSDETYSFYGDGAPRRGSPPGRPDPAYHTEPGPSWDDAVRAYEEDR
jgi:hypothetical protein